MGTGTRLRTAFVGFSLCLTMGCQSVLFGSLGIAGRGKGIETRQGIIFDSAYKLALDVYRPVNASHAPIVVFFYGGTWKDGTRSWYRFVGESLSKRGLVVVIPDYRKYPDVRFPTFMEDAAKATRWAYDHAQDFGGDPRALFVMGHSAGAHIGALLATDARYLQAVHMKPRDLTGFIGLAGPYDFAPTRDPELQAIFGDTLKEQRVSQPVNYVDGDEPPMLLLHGRSDTTVWPRNSEGLAAKLRVFGEFDDLKLYPGVGHSRILLSLAPLLSGWSPALVDTLSFINSQSATSTASEVHSTPP